MSFAEAVAALRTIYPKALLSPSVTHGGCRARAVAVDFKNQKRWLYTGRDAKGAEVMLYFNDKENLICCIDDLGGKATDE